MLNIHTTSKRFGRKPSSIVKGAIKSTGLGKRISAKDFINYKFQPNSLMAAQSMNIKRSRIRKRIILTLSFNIFLNEIFKNNGRKCDKLFVLSALGRYE